MQEACDSRYIIVRQQIGGVLIQESGGDENLELLAPIEVQDVTDTVQYFAADAPFTRFEPAECAPIDLGQMSGLLLSQTALVSEPRQHAS